MLSHEICYSWNAYPTQRGKGKWTKMGEGWGKEMKQGSTAPRKNLEEYKVNEFIRCKILKAIYQIPSQNNINALGNVRQNS